ncbi:thiamine-phosphate kinase [Malaciobacter halophilus]|uniref:Thiamine-monophosphate kinase n=1 Tax=Malaciobacter halophilus TaxID=197482 RepID=A0A2N1J5M0_9BACT|nr:thiamine-phosphate kinase [Malaciobacter halophilus]AXH09233.1 thiamine monophosphate kinase [Malaciobacter halophilus]PKI81868.1 thiamine-phosphate kinase [Malaciobacter halophilus]
MNKEDYFIQQFTNQTKLIGDDAAVVGNMVYSQDAFFENVHFKREWMSLKQIASKAMLVNISDAIAMNAKPLYALLTVAIPKDFSTSDLRKLANGFKKVANDYGIKIIGGDTISNEKLDISITIISQTSNPKYRADAKIGDLVCYTGTLGSCKKDLKKLLKGKKVPSKAKFIKPKLKGDFFYDISKYVNASLDISDGLFFELQRVSKASKVGFEFFDEISPEVGTSGEEYEMLFTFPKKHLEKVMLSAKNHKVPLNIFAKVIKGSYKTTAKNHHF